ncbi:hypothetical protein Lal_00007806 [Lupinus albus]|uniref:Uncharacterized protein n=1 Tax=Lupinus albus TaxID=3870 RepID=A0A6A5MVT5_LUPAL|nr:hypothetical protein Lalb_Chr16g0383941 [Lupinus albus]KAF1875190.1 hypothetical protein Lal_00007806 [Lupinus albus]
MGTHEGNKKGSHVASDSISEYSLSFAGLVCIHDQQQQQPKPYVPDRDKFIRVSKTDPDFEFDIDTKNKIADLNNNSAATPIKKITHADVLISSGQIKAQQEVAKFQPNSPISLSTFLGIGDHRNMSNGRIQVVRKGRNHANKEGSMTRKSFGKKVCKSFLAPCRQCKAIKPGAVKGQTTVPREKYNLLA